MTPSGWIAEAMDAAGQAADDAIDLGGTALALAALDHPGIDPAPYREHLDGLVADLGALIGSWPTADALSLALARRAGYRGDQDTYDDPVNGDLIRVIDRRRGLPVALGLIYLHVAARAGIAMSGLTFPGHFLVRVDDPGARVIIDPFNGGAVVALPELRRLLKSILGADAEPGPEHWRDATRRDVLLRLLNNLKSRAIRSDDAPRALELARRMTWIAPAQPALWLEFGLLAGHQGQVTAAVEALETCLALAPAAGIAREASILLRTWRRNLN